MEKEEGDKVWRYYSIGKNHDDWGIFYAPDLLHAFHLARQLRYGSVTLICYSSSEKDPR